MIKSLKLHVKTLAKYVTMMLISYFMLTAPASAITIQEILSKGKDVLSSGKEFAIALGYVAAVICIVIAGFKLKAKAEGDHQVKVAQVIILFIAAIILGGGAFWVQTTADSVGVEVQTDI